MIRVLLPIHLQRLANVNREVELVIETPLVTQSIILDALEIRYPMLRGTIRDHFTKERRAYVRFFACGQDISLESPNRPLPESIANGTDRFMIIGAIAGG
ncbi:MAG: MoaD/ThiS family protein [Chloroflexota bacterium]